MHESREGLITVHLAVLIFSLTALFSKLIPLSSVDITFYRSVFAVMMIAVYMAYKKQSYLLDTQKDFFMAVLLGALLTAHWVSYFYSMQISSVAVGVIALYTFPVITVFLEPLFHGEKPHRVDILSSIAVLIGITIIVPEFSLDNDTTLGVAWGVFSALMMSLRNIMQRRYFSSYPASKALFYQANMVVVLLFLFRDAPAADIEADNWWLLLLLGIFFTALPHTLFAHGLRHLKAKTASLIASVQVVYAAIFAALILGEWLTWNVVAGGSIIVSAAVFESLQKNKSV
jgi:drug/metabolite transporter (DMT)-like permease